MSYLYRIAAVQNTKSFVPHTLAALENCVGQRVVSPLNNIHPLTHSLHPSPRHAPLPPIILTYTHAHTHIHTDTFIHELWLKESPIAELR